jgi:hypothetical protein
VNPVPDVLHVFSASGGNRTRLQRRSWNYYLKGLKEEVRNIWGVAGRSRLDICESLEYLTLERPEQFHTENAFVARHTDKCIPSTAVTTSTLTYAICLYGSLT